jgi:hypothetical protein
MSKIDKLGINSPCTADWNKMKGNDRIRYCEECKRYVHDFSRLPRRQVQDLIAASPGRICARLTYNEDDSVIFLDSRTLSRSESQKASPLATAIVTAMITISTGIALPVFASPPVTSSIVQGELRKDSKDKKTEGQTASIAGTVQELTGDPIPGAIIMIVNEKTGEAQTGTSNSKGGFRFSNLQSGRYTTQIEASGFQPFTNQKLYVYDGQEQTLDIKLAPRIALLGVAVLPALSLRELYDQSHVIVIAQAGKSKKVKTDEYGSLFKTEYHIKESLKGEFGPTFQLEHEIDKGSKPLKQGTNVILFLKNPMPRSDKSDKSDRRGYELVDDGFKQLTEAEIAVYAARILELKGIMQADEPDQKAIVEWLVRCIEDPATRRDGVTELQSSFEDIASAEDDEEEADEDEARDDTGDSKDTDADLQSGELSPNEQNGEIPLASLLTPDQKKRLSSVLFNGDMDRSSILLISMVRRWDSKLLVPFLIEQLRRNEGEPLFWAGDVVTALAEMIDNEEVSEMADKFYESDLDDDAEGKDAKVPVELVRKRSMLLKDFLKAVERSLKKQ